MHVKEGSPRGCVRTCTGIHKCKLKYSWDDRQFPNDNGATVVMDMLVKEILLFN